MKRIVLIRVRGTTQFNSADDDVVGRGSVGTFEFCAEHYTSIAERANVVRKRSAQTELLKDDFLVSMLARLRKVILRRVPWHFICPVKSIFQKVLKFVDGHGSVAERTVIVDLLCVNVVESQLVPVTKNLKKLQFTSHVFRGTTVNSQKLSICFGSWFDLLVVVLMVVFIGICTVHVQVAVKVDHVLDEMSQIVSSELSPKVSKPIQHVLKKILDYRLGLFATTWVRSDDREPRD